jgi:branched-chain amino acid transport system ATP-binding protein
MHMALLELVNIHTYYGNIHALKGLSITVDQSEIVTLIGGNGAGKSTTLKTISGLLHPHPGAIYLDGEDLTSFKAHEIVMKGVVQVPEGRQVFNRLSVVENLEMGAFITTTKKIAALHGRVFTLFPRLKERRSNWGHSEWW